LQSLLGITKPGDVHLGVAGCAGGSGNRAKATAILWPDAPAQVVIEGADPTAEPPKRNPEVVQCLAIFPVIETSARGNQGLELTESGTPAAFVRRRTQ
jgi:hypothetical protein